MLEIHPTFLALLMKVSDTTAVREMRRIPTPTATSNSTKENPLRSLALRVVFNVLILDLPEPTDQRPKVKLLETFDPSTVKRKRSPADV